jgi:His/Glu/Gln/Arg/opine family amino acid ABC transporter permease subunit
MSIEILLTILKGVPITLLLTLGALLIGAVGAIPLLIARQSRFWPLSFLARSAIEPFRGIRPIVCLFIIFFGLGNITRPTCNGASVRPACFPGDRDFDGIGPTAENPSR